MNRTLTFAASIAVAGGVGLLGIGTAATAMAQGPSYQGGNCPPGMTCTHWCPGESTPPGSQVLTWDWNVCHDWYWDSYGITDVTTNTMYPWSGAPRPATPPPGSLRKSWAAVSPPPR